MADVQSATAEIRRGKKKERNKKPPTQQKYNVRICYAGRPKKFPEFSTLFHSYNYTFPEVITTKILAIWQHLGQFLAIFSPYMCRNGYFS